MTHLKEGQKAPSFEGIDQDGNKISLGDFTGKKVILYFYPKDDTPGCTAEACNLRDNYQDLIKKGFVVIGVSADTESSHKKFAGKYSLPFPLIADTSKSIITSYGVWGEKNIYGKTAMGILRSTFVIDEKGFIDKIISKVDTSAHTEQIIKSYTK
jgi:peroxiredoxin Q/BCP